MALKRGRTTESAEGAEAMSELMEMRTRKEMSERRGKWERKESRGAKWFETNG